MYVDNKPSLNTFKNVKDMSNMFYACTSLKTLDLSEYKLPAVTNMENMFNKMTNLVSMQVGNQFAVVENSKEIFENTDNLRAIIITGKTPKVGAFTNAKQSLSSNVKFYVEAETAYEKSWASDFGKERIEPILALVGNSSLKTSLNSVYEDLGCYVAGFTKLESENYMPYGYSVVSSGDVDVTIENKYQREYTLTRTYESEGQQVTNEIMKLAREIDVVDKPKYMVTEWSVTGEVGLEIILPVSGAGLNITVDWGDGTEEVITKEFPTHKYAKVGTYEIYVVGDCMYWGEAEFDIKKPEITSDNKYYTYTKYLTKVKQLGELKAKSYRFAQCTNLTELRGEALVSTNTFENVVDMSNMFYNCDKLINLDMSKFNTSNVTNMSGMFAGCGVSNIEINNFDTQNVKDMSNMFSNCKALTNIDVSTLNTENVVNMNNMFSNCTALTSIDVSAFNTSNVTNMSNMFSGCTALVNIDVSGLNTSKVTDMNNMFSNCTGLTSVNVSAFNTSNVTNMRYMFYNCSKLKELDVNNFDTRNVINMNYMFAKCTEMTNLDISNFNTEKASMYRICDEDRNLRSIMVGEKFLVLNDVDVFYGVQKLTAIIITSTTPVANKFKGQLPAGTTLYVPNGCEDAYKEALSGDTDASKIKPIIEPIGEKEVGVLLGTPYEEQNFTVAGFGVEEAEYYMAYGYNVEVSGDVNTNENGTYKVEYILTRTYKDTDGTQKEERHIATRIVKVYDAPVVNLYENNAPYSGDWTNKDVVAIMNILSSKTTWIAIRVENGDWSIEPTYAKIEKSGDQMIATFNTSLNGKVYFKEVDVAGNATTYESEASIIKIDKESPVIEEIKAETIDGVIKLKASIKEELSGIGYYAVVASGEEITWKKYEQADSKIEETLLASGKYQLWLKDRAQNEASGEIIAKKDVEPPKGSIDIVATNIISGDKYTNQDAVLININVTDNQTDQERIMYAIYNEEDYKEVKAGTKEIEWKQYTPTVTWVLKEPQGINIIYAVFKDRAGNISMSQGILETP